MVDLNSIHIYVLVFAFLSKDLANFLRDLKYFAKIKNRVSLMCPIYYETGADRGLFAPKSDKMGTPGPA